MAVTWEASKPHLRLVTDRNPDSGRNRSATKVFDGTESDVYISHAVMSKIVVSFPIPPPPAPGLSLKYLGF